MPIRVRYTRQLADGVYLVYRSQPPELLVNETWWRAALLIQRSQVLESLWARLPSLTGDVDQDILTIARRPRRWRSSSTPARRRAATRRATAP
jgi:hypothetical protein